MARRDNDVAQILTNFACSSFASISAEAVTFPLDTIKVSLQAQRTTSRGFISTLAHIVRDKGFKGLYPGLFPALGRSIVYGGASMAAYRPIRQALCGDIDPKDMSFAMKLIAAGSAGALGQWIATPFDVVKIRLQAQTAGIHDFGYAGANDAVRKILHHDGIRGLWRGAVPAAQRAVVVTGTWMATYDHAKHFVKNHTSLGDGLGNYVLSSLMATFVGAVCSSPMDVMKTRLVTSAMIGASGSAPSAGGSAAASAGPVAYRGMIDCLVKTVRAEGLLALYKGFVPSLARQGPWSCVYFVVYEHVTKAVLGQSQI